MAATLEIFEKQPGDTITYKVSFVDWLTDMGDSGSSIDVTVPDGITLVSDSLVSGVANVKLSGGTDDVSYVITVALTTNNSHVKNAEFTVKVKEIP